LRSWKRLPETKARLKAFSDTLKISESTSEVECAIITHSVSKDKTDTDNTECAIITHSVSKDKTDTDNTEYLRISYSVVKEPIYTSGRGYGAVTWVHPIMAVHLASYLDPAFANYVAEVFVRYITADPTLAADIASRQETTEGLDIINREIQERHEFLESKIARAYYVIKDVWGDKLHYNTLTEEIQFNGSPLELQSLKIRIERELHLKLGKQDVKEIVKILAILNTYPSMDAVNQKRFEGVFKTFIKVMPPGKSDK
jgi:hypothetical protein